MANDVKWTQWQPSEIEEGQSTDPHTNPRSALLQLLGCVVGLGALVMVLPGPASWVDVLSGNPTGTAGPVWIGDTAETAILLTASVLVWVLLAWVLVVWIAAVAGRLPGAPGQCGRALLRRMAPATAGRIVAAAVGVSLLAGTSACAVPAMGDLGSGAATQFSANNAATPAPLGGGAGVVDPVASNAPQAAATTETTTTGSGSVGDVIASIVIDWPAPETAASTADTTVPTPTDPAEATDSADIAGPGGTAVPAETTQSPTAAPGNGGEGAANTAEPRADPTAEPSTPAPAAGAPGTDPADAPQAPTTSAPPSDAEDSAQNATPTAAPAGRGTLPIGADSPGGVSVLSGDTLWSIARHHLSPDATDDEVDTAWRAWYSANTQVIGENPDLIQPGQLLLPPDPEMGR